MDLWPKAQEQTRVSREIERESLLCLAWLAKQSLPNSVQLGGRDELRGSQNGREPGNSCARPTEP